MNTKHKLVWKIVRPVIGVYLFLKFKYRKEMAVNLPENYIVVANHITNWDSLFLATAFREQMYFVASEHIARKSWYPIIKSLVRPIIRRKGTTAVSTVKEVLQITRKGGNVALFPEGDRAWDGVTCPIMPATGKMIKSGRCGLVTYKIEGGYFLNPRWSMTMRKGFVTGKLVNVYTKEEIAKMSPDEINSIIARDLYEDAYETQEKLNTPYKGFKMAEGMENLLFICPECGKRDSFTSSEDTVTCRECGHSFRFSEYGMLEGGKFDTIRDFSFWQKEIVKKDAEKGAVYTAVTGELVEIENHKEIPVASGVIKLSREKLTCGDVEFLMEDISELAIHSRSCIVFSADKHYYELRAPERVNVFKLTLLYNAYKGNTKIANR